ncbi:MAG: hypothetical protein QOC99_1710 [Acidobacteriota bacterium]|jgi:hypothetical protein|nr:hypothetical protein [Acidobacteriota bacterium]MDT7779198.1 hypothetical protein [Acidobacteriota bacterium]
MTGEEKQHRQTERKAYYRRNRRENICFPVRLEIPSDEGGTQVIKAHTLVVSHAGATLDMDVTIPIGMGLQVSPPFGGTILAEVNGAWVEQESGRHRVSIRLIDPPAWTSPERFSVSGGVSQEQSSLRVHPGTSQMLAEYTAYLNETTGEETPPDKVAANILERAFQSDEKFQEWFDAKILEDLQAWEKACVREG